MHYGTYGASTYGAMVVLCLGMGMPACGGSSDAANSNGSEAITREVGDAAADNRSDAGIDDDVVPGAEGSRSADPKVDSGRAAASDGSADPDGLPATAATSPSDGGEVASLARDASANPLDGAAAEGHAGSGNAFILHNLAVLNQYRTAAGLMPYVLDATLSTFALAGAEELSMDHQPHQHFKNAMTTKTLFTAASGFRTSAGENQGDPNGWPSLSPDASTSEDEQIDAILAAMFAEGPSGGHYQNIMSTAFTRVGIGLVEVSGMLYLCNDFSN